MRRTLIVVAVLAVMLWPAAPAHAVVHEIVGQWCAGQGELEPPGLSGGSNADNIAQPLLASGVVQVVPYPAGGPNAVLIDFDFTKPQLKIAPTGAVVELIPGELYAEGFVLDTGKGFTHCKRLSDLS